MYAWTMLTELNCQSSTPVKMPLYSIIFTQYFILLLMIFISTCRATCGLVLSVFVMICILKLLYVNLATWRASPAITQLFTGSFSQNKHVHCSLQASGLAAKWWWLHYDEVQDAIFCFCGISMCLWLHFKNFSYMI